MLTDFANICTSFTAICLFERSFVSSLSFIIGIINHDVLSSHEYICLDFFGSILMNRLVAIHMNLFYIIVISKQLSK